MRASERTSTVATLKRQALEVDLPTLRIRQFQLDAALRYASLRSARLEGANLVTTKQVFPTGLGRLESGPIGASTFNKLDSGLRANFALCH